MKREMAAMLFSCLCFLGCQSPATSSNPPKSDPPTIPNGLAAMGGNGKVLVSWPAVAGATSYNLYWSATSSFGALTGTKISGVTSPYTKTGLTNGTAYYFAVAAQNSGGESSLSVIISGIPTAKIINTVAGNGTAGFSGDGAMATSAALNTPTGTAVASSGNIYIADFYNNRIRKVETNGIISTIAGNGTAGYSGDGGPATAAQLNRPSGVAVDLAENVYIIDNNNNRIRKVNTNGTISTFAGTGIAGFSGDGGQATSANINGPSTGIAIDASGNLLFSDSQNQRVRKVSLNGIISTVAGSGTNGFSGDGAQATSAALSYPQGLFVATSGDIYITDYVNNRIRKVSSTGMIVTVAGNGTSDTNGDGGLATSASLKGYNAVVDSLGNIFIASYGVIRKVDTSGIISTVAGTGDSTSSFNGDGLAPLASNMWAYTVSIDSSDNLYFVDGHRIRKIQ